MEKDLFLGRAAVSRGFASAQEILECLKVQVAAEALLGKHFLLGELLFVRGLINEAQYRELVAGTTFSGARTEEISMTDTQKVVPAPLTGEVLIEQGLATPAQVLEALDRQRQEDLLGAPHRKIGEILVAENVVLSEDLDSTLKLVFKKSQDPPPPESRARPSQKG